jgi:glycosyltransferase involved in cell wall biosynthesis
VKGGEDGYFVDCGDVNGLIGKLETVLGSFSKAKEMGDNGKKTLRELFMAKRTGDEFMKMYQASGH